MFKQITAALLLSSACLTASPAFAHHGSNGQFDMESTIYIEGVVTKMKFVNPHSYVYFDVTPADGTAVQEWRCEMRAGSAMKRAGWDIDMFKEGTTVSITGAAARREPQGCYVRSISFDGGPNIQRNITFDKDGNTIAPPRELKTESGVTNIAGNWGAERQQRGGPPGGATGGGERGGMGAPTTGETPERGGMTGPPAGRGPGGGYSLTAAGQAASANFNAEIDNPRYHCKATNIFHDFWFDQHVNTITQTDTKIMIKYGFMDIVRTIHLNMDAHPKDITPSRAGHSIGSWDGDVLVVDTVGFAEGYLDPRGGTKHSDQLHTVERFTMSKDGTSLTQSYEGTDPVYLSAPFKGEREVKFTTDEFDAYSCEDLTEEVVSGF